MHEVLVRHLGLITQGKSSNISFLRAEESLFLGVDSKLDFSTLYLFSFVFFLKHLRQVRILVLSGCYEMSWYPFFLFLFSCNTL